MKKTLIVMLVMIALIATMTTLIFTSCKATEEEVVELKPIAAKDIKIGLICLHSETSPYDKNFITAMEEAVTALGLNKETQLIIKRDVDESEAAASAAEDLIEQGCDIIFADSFGHETYLIPVAKANPTVQFCHATGTKAMLVETPANYHNAFASIYEGRYLAGVAAGLKLNEMIAEGKITPDKAKMGYVGAFPYAEVKSGYTSFYLGAKSVCPTVTMSVKFTQYWYDVTRENETAKALINEGCVLISQHADSMGAPNACEEARVPNVSYNVSTKSACPNTYLVASRINWAPYYTYAIQSVINGTKIDANWTGTLATGSVEIVDINTNAFKEDPTEIINEKKAQLMSGALNVYDCSTFTYNGGKTLTSYKADVIDLGDFKGETEVVINGIFAESKFRSAPYFDIDIDGITVTYPTK